MPRAILLIGICAIGLNGCRSNDPQSPLRRPSPPAQSRENNALTGTTATDVTSGTADRGQLLAYLNARPLRAPDLQGLLIEAAGGEVLAELVLDRMISRRLEEQELRFGPELLRQERTRLVSTLDPDTDQAERVLAELRARRGLGDLRFNLMLRRNAGLRLLIQDRARPSQDALKNAYQLTYGPRYEARLIVTPTLAEAANLARRVREGESFVDLAYLHSTDPTRAQGGWLPPVSPADTTYPSVIRAALLALEPGEVSEPIALETSFALIQVERKVHGPAVEFDNVKEDLARVVRQQAERTLMQRLARTLLEEADVVITDRVLKDAWAQQKRRLIQHQQ